MLVIPGTALVSRIWTSEAFFAFCCAEAANKARHSNAMVETLMRLSVSGAFPYVGGRGCSRMSFGRGDGRWKRRRRGEKVKGSEHGDSGDEEEALTSHRR